MHCGESARAKPATQTASEIIWRAEQEDYVLRRGPQAPPEPVPRQAQEWRAWLEQQSALTFKGRLGRLSLRRETRKGRPIYWYAFRHCLHRTFKQYIGKTEVLTLERLEEVAAELEHSCRHLHERMRARHGSPFHQAAEPLLLARLRPPQPASDLIAREPQLSLLERGRERRLILLCAPAGSGKTTLVLQWLAHLRKSESGAPPVAWLTLEAGDNEPARFWRYLVAACAPWLPAEESQRLATVEGSVLASGLAALPSVAVSVSEPPASLLAPLLNLLNEGGARGLLILDNYHLISNEAIHQIVALLISHLPAGLCLVLLTREEPPLPLAGLRAAGELLELRGPELRFTQAESAAFLQPYGLAPAQLEQIERLIAGWPAGLRLLSLLLERERLANERDGRPLTPAVLERLLKDFRGSQHLLFDYFSSEVLQGLPPHLQDFLLRTCWLPNLQPDLCRAVSDRRESAQLLAELERSNLFIERLEEAGQTYRYYPLFAEALQHEARQRLSPGELRLIAYRASRWYEEHNQLSQAIELALQAGLSERAADLIERQSIPLRLRDEGQSLARLRSWLAALPRPVIWGRPQLCLLSVLTVLDALRDERQAAGREPRLTPAEEAQINELLRRAEAQWRRSDDRAGLGRLYACRVLVLEHLPAAGGRASQQAQESASYARAALEQLAPEESDWRLLCLGHLFGQALQQGDLYEAERLTRQMENLLPPGKSHQSAADEWIGNLSGLRAFILNLRGQLQEAAHLYRQLTTLNGPQHPLTLLSILSQAQILYDWNNLSGAEEQLALLEERLNRLLAEGEGDERRTALASLLGLPVAQLRALIRQARGQLDEACASLRGLLLQAYRNLSLTEINHYLLCDLLVWLARLELARGNPEGARDSLYDLGRLLGLIGSDHREEREPVSELVVSEGQPRLAARSTPDSSALPPSSEEGTDGPPVPEHQVEAEAERLVPTRQAPSGLILEQYQLLSARLLLANGQARQASLLLEAVQERAQRYGRGRSLLQARLLLARAYAQQRDPVLASAYLCRALEQAHIEGHRRLILDEGEPLAALLRELLPRLRGQLLRAYAEGLLQDFAATRSQQPPIITTVEAAPPEPFSAQELRVLRLLASGCTNAEIARELVVSINTVRTHLQHIYQKLNVHSRHRAITAARRYGLL
ncbi:LuxR C-terminal-related transcriptional regulator [Thermogemmatispora sp.]|uniref:LuxR C-terminal-related transcriptional regulator n=1 Tax=Thermogemmatispora sp. TaxID=1968838 RepID=UPI0035E4522D